VQKNPFHPYSQLAVFNFMCTCCVQ